MNFFSFSKISDFSKEKSGCYNTPTIDFRKNRGRDFSVHFPDREELPAEGRHGQSVGRRFLWEQRKRN